jgi:hypothetical protein
VSEDLALLEEQKQEKLLELSRDRLGTLHIPTQDELQFAKSELISLKEEEDRISQMIDILDSEHARLSLDEDYCKYAYVTLEDILSLSLS